MRWPWWLQTSTFVHLIWMMLTFLCMSMRRHKSMKFIIMEGPVVCFHSPPQWFGLLSYRLFTKLLKPVNGPPLLTGVCVNNFQWRVFAALMGILKMRRWGFWRWVCAQCERIIVTVPKARVCGSPNQVAGFPPALLFTDHELHKAYNHQACDACENQLLLQSEGRSIH